VAGLFERLLARSGILAALRQQMRDEVEAARTQLETKLQDEFTSLRREIKIMRATMMLDAEHVRRGLDVTSQLDTARVAAHVARAISGARVETDPSVHVVIDNLVPADTYQALIDGIPPRLFFTQREDAKQNLKLDQLEIAPQVTIRTLSFLEGQLIPQMMVPALLRHFAPHIREFYVREYGPERGEKLAAIPHAATGGRLMLRRRGYHLDPHLDPRRVVFTTLIYFARPGESEAYGTSFYRMSAMPKIDRTSTFYPESQGIRCELVKLVPFRPNSAVSFLNYGGAHGADIPKDAPADLERYAYQFYVSPDPAALAAVTGESAGVESNAEMSNTSRAVVTSVSSEQPRYRPAG
jgi:hypothetical protein